MACDGVGFFAVAISANTSLYARRNNSNLAHFRTPHNSSNAPAGLFSATHLFLVPAYANAGDITAPWGVPLPVRCVLPFFAIPTVSHFLSRRKMRLSAHGPLHRKTSVCQHPVPNLFSSCKDPLAMHPTHHVALGQIAGRPSANTWPGSAWYRGK